MRDTFAAVLLLGTVLRAHTSFALPADRRYRRHYVPLRRGPSSPHPLAPWRRAPCLTSSARASTARERSLARRTSHVVIRQGWWFGRCATTALRALEARSTDRGASA